MKIKHYIARQYNIAFLEAIKSMPMVERMLETNVDEFNKLFSNDEDNLKIILDKIWESAEKEDIQRVIHYIATVVAYINVDSAYDGLRPFIDDKYYKERTKQIDKLGKMLWD